MEELSVITVMYEVYKKTLKISAVLDKKYRFTLGEQAVLSARAVLRELFFAKHAARPDKMGYLRKAEAEAELVAVQLRAILELGLANETNCLKIQAKLAEARRMIGGWRKSLS